MITSNTIFETSCSDNSHLFGVPFTVSEHTEARMVIKRADLREWLGKTEFLSKAGVDFRFNYKPLVEG